MTKKLYALLLAASVLVVSSSAFAQYKPGDDNYAKNNKGKDQNSKWRSGKELYPSKPKNMWEIGITGGAAFTSGDVNVDFGYGFGGHIRKAIGHVISLRLDYAYMKTKGLNWRWSTASYGSNNKLPFGSFIRNPILTQKLGGLGAANSTSLGGYGINDVYFHNYQNKIHDLSLQMVASLNNLNFYRAKNKWDLFAYFGVGGIMYQTYYNALNGDKTYAADFNSIYTKYHTTGNTITTSSGQTDWRAVKDDLKAVMDDSYETRAELRVGDERLGDYTARATAVVGTGIGYRLSDRITLGLEGRVTLTNDDLIDGQRWEETRTLTAQDDNIVYTALHLNLHLGSKNKRTVPLWWLNPYDNQAEDIAALKRKMNEIDPKKMFKDSDEDGVVDYLDQEPNTKAGCPVDTKGRALDSDKDGVLDCDDDELFTRPGVPVDSRGVGPKQDFDCSKCNFPTPKGMDCWYFPYVNFANGSDRVKPEFYGELYQVASLLQANPSLNIEIKGNAGNEDLARRRAEAIKRFLVEKYGISESRLTIATGTDGSVITARNSRENYMNNRVDFRCL